MLSLLLDICKYFVLFVLYDRVLTAVRLEGVYYAVHTIHNAMIIRSTAPEVWKILTNFSGIFEDSTNYDAFAMCVALHAYHIALYYKKFRFDDWLHHGLMIGIALPIATIAQGGPLLGFSLFFTTGLPGGIDYALLFLTRNNWLARTTEKRINTFLNVWIRAPGCTAQAILTIVYMNLVGATGYEFAGGVVTAALNYWNGQYFMAQVVRDYALVASASR
jgi:hypothetical protein